MDRNTKEFLDRSLDSYLAVCDSALCQSRGLSFGIGGIRSTESRRRAEEAWRALQRARIFAVDYRAYAKAYRKADIHTTEKIAGLKWYGPPDDQLIVPQKQEPDGIYDALSRMETMGLDPTESEHIMVACAEAGKHLPFPASQLPFDAVFLAYGGGIGISADAMGARAGVEGLAFLIREGFVRFVLNGHLLWVEGDRSVAYSFVSGTREDGKWHTMVVRAYDGEWDHPYDLDPWVVPTLIAGINENRKIHVQNNWTPGQRFTRSHHREAKSLPIPQPYYHVKLRDEVIDDVFERTVASRRPMREFSHRFDVRGHECVRVLRGQLPIDPEIKDRLDHRGYRIYTGGNTLSEDHERLLARKVRPRSPDEWMAILVYWRDPHVRGPENRPYVPAMRY